MASRLCVGRRFYACGTSRGSMWLEHGIRERPECFEAVLLTGSYANADYRSGTQHNQTVMGETLQRTPLPVITCMSPIDACCGTRCNQIIGLAFELMMALSFLSPGSLLELVICETWTHDDISVFVVVMTCLVTRNLISVPFDFVCSI